MPNHFKIRTEKTGHYFTHGSLTGDTKYVWICLHGYGQLAKYFIQKFTFLDPQSHFVVAPEGLNRFYFEGVNERPVATWMTREDRLDEIADFVLFLNLLREKIGWDKNPNTKVIYLGFSQGVTTLLRWLEDAAPRANYLLLWAGGIPDDISFAYRKSYFQQISSHYFVGDKDPYFDTTLIKDKKPMLEAIGLSTELHSFSGSHTVDEVTLRAWAEKYLEQ